MKLVISLLVVVLVVTIEAMPKPDFATHRSKRGFKMGASSRFSHGFGKRTDSGALDLSDIPESNSAILTVQDLAVLLQNDPHITYLIAKSVDRDDDGLISRDELAPIFTQ